MKSPLLLPALALATVGAILAGELHALLVEPQPRGPAGGSNDPELPVSSQGRPSRPADVALLVHQPAADPACGNRDAPEQWYVSLRTTPGLAAAITPYPFPVSARELLLDQLRKVASGCPKTTSHPECTEGILAIRASGDVPYHVVYRLIEGGSCACFYRLEFAVHGSSPGSGEQRLEVPLPSADPGQTWNLRVTIRRNVMTGACERCLAGVEPEIPDLVPEDLADPDDRSLSLPTARVAPEPRPARPTFPCDAEGDTRFRLCLEQWLADPGNEHYRPLLGLVEPTADVPLQAVVDLIDAFRRAGLEQIGFSSTCLTR